MNFLSFGNSVMVEAISVNCFLSNFVSNLESITSSETCSKPVHSFCINGEITVKLFLRDSSKFSSNFAL